MCDVLLVGGVGELDRFLNRSAPLIGRNIFQACWGDVEHAGGWNVNPLSITAQSDGALSGLQPNSESSSKSDFLAGRLFKISAHAAAFPERFLPKPTEPFKPFKQIVFGIGGRSQLCYCTLRSPLPLMNLGNLLIFSVLSRICPSCLFRTDQTSRACAALKQRPRKTMATRHLHNIVIASGALRQVLRWVTPSHSAFTWHLFS